MTSQWVARWFDKTKSNRKKEYKPNIKSTTEKERKCCRRRCLDDFYMQERFNEKKSEFWRRRGAKAVTWTRVTWCCLCIHTRAGKCPNPAFLTQTQVAWSFGKRLCAISFLLFLPHIPLCDSRWGPHAWQHKTERQRHDAAEQPVDNPDRRGAAETYRISVLQLMRCWHHINMPECRFLLSESW